MFVSSIIFKSDLVKSFLIKWDDFLFRVLIISCYTDYSPKWRYAASVPLLSRVPTYFQWCIILKTSKVRAELSIQLRSNSGYPP